VRGTLVIVFVVWWASMWACSAPRASAIAALEADNPLRPIPDAPLGIAIVLRRMPSPPTPATVRLGRWLFFDRRLSRDGTLSCASCHQPQYAFSQPTPVATGIDGRRGRRKVPPILNLAASVPVNFRREPQTRLFWDGRASSLERQALQPVVNPDEMGSSGAAMVQAVSHIGGYRRYFAAAFGDPAVTTTRVARALADYERTRMSGNSPYDRWTTGHDDAAMPESAKAGYRLFAGKAQCAHCHHAPFFGGGFHNTGIGWNAATHTFADDGAHAVTKGTIDEEWPGTFKAPTLREVARRAPYMHDGSIPTLRQVVEYYNRGANPNPYLNAFIRPLGLTPKEVGDVVAFLESLSGEGWQDPGPSQFPR
jgi:cytochrome c peroxidase